MTQTHRYPRADSPPDLFRFGIFELDTRAAELRRAGRRVRLNGQPLRLLELLVRRGGDLVTREEIRAHVWGDATHVDFDQGINACMRQVRGALGDCAESPRFVETVPRRGYRFVAPVGDGSRKEPVAAAATPRARRAIHGGLVALGLALTLLLLAVGFARWRLSPAGRADRPVLVVLPFQDLSVPEGHAGFGDALTEELIAELGRRYAGGQAIIARTSSMAYKTTAKTIGTIAHELDADYVLEGSVRHAEGRVRVTAQLIRGADESHVWVNQYDREPSNLLDVQTELGRRISEALGLRLLPDDALRASAAAADAAAYASYLKGRQLLRGRRIGAAFEHFERATRLDPAFAPAWLGRAETFRHLRPGPESHRRARHAVETALALDDSLARAHLLQANMRFYHGYDLEGARRAYERAIELDPNLAGAHHQLAAYYSVTGQHDRALDSVRRALRLDPRSTMVRGDVGWYYYFARHYDLAVRYSLDSLALAPDFFWSDLCLQLAWLQQGDYASILERGRREMLDAGATAEELATVRVDDARKAVHAYWRWCLDRLERRAETGYVSPARFAQLHMMLDDRERALASLEAGFARRSAWIVPFLRVDPLFDPLRSDARFRDLVARTGATAIRASR